MQIYVINLEKAKDRRESIKKQLRGLSLSFDFFRGVDGRKLTTEKRDVDYSKAKAYRRIARELVPAEIGCALSHIGVYQDIVAKKLPFALILEDDVIISSDIQIVLSALSKKLDADSPEVILLSPAQGVTKSESLVKLTKNYTLSPYVSGYYTSSYVVTFSAAQALLRELYPIGDVADCWLRLQNYRVVDISVTNPNFTEQQQDDFGSSTTADRVLSGSKYSLKQQIFYKLRRVRAIIVDFFYAPYRRKFVPYAGLEVSKKKIF